MKFLADMGISLRTVEWLREQSYDTLHLRDQGLQRLPDGEIIEKAYQLLFRLKFRKKRPRQQKRLRK